MVYGFATAGAAIDPPSGQLLRGNQGGHGRRLLFLALSLSTVIDKSTMRDMLYGDAPSFEAVLAGVRQLEQEINRL